MLCCCVPGAVGLSASEAIKQIAVAAAVFAESDSDLDLGTLRCVHMQMSLSI